MKLAEGVHLEGTFYCARPGDRNTPSIESYVDQDSLQIIGRPDRVLVWFSDIDIHHQDIGDAQDRAVWLDGLASQLRDHHENSYI